MEYVDGKMSERSGSPFKTQFSVIDRKCVGRGSSEVEGDERTMNGEMKGKEKKKHIITTCIRSGAEKDYTIKTKEINSKVRDARGELLKGGVDGVLENLREQKGVLNRKLI